MVFKVGCVLISWLLIHVATVSAQCSGTDYDDSKECQYETISSLSSIVCDGFSSCRGSTVSDTESMVVDCRGAGSCINLKTDTESADLFELDCEGYLSCANTVVNMTNYQSGSSNPVVDCEGSLSCVNSIVYGSDIFITDYTNLTEPTFAEGIRLVSNGYGALANVNAMNVEVRYGNIRGYYGFYNGKMRLSDSGYVELLSRLAGYNGYILCPANYSCIVDCNNWATACYGLTFDCETPDTCGVLRCNENNGIWCPQGSWIDGLNDNNYFNYFDSGTGDNYTVQWYDLDGIDAMLVPSYEQVGQTSVYTSLTSDDNSILDSIFYNSQCLKSTNKAEELNGVCDDTRSCRFYDIDINSNANITFFTNTTEGESSVVCARGQQSLRGSENLVNFECEYDISCDGDQTCIDNIFYGKNYYAHGDASAGSGNGYTKLYSCNSELSDEYTSLHCFGQFSCKNVDVINNFENIFCLGDGSCDIINDIRNVNNIFVFGQSSFSDVNITVSRDQTFSLLIDLNKNANPDITIYCDDDSDDYAEINVYCFEPDLTCANNINLIKCHNDTYNVSLYAGEKILPVFSKSKSGSNNSGSSDDIAAIIIGVCVGIVLLILIILCIWQRVKWMWIPGYLIALARNWQNRHRTRHAVGEHNVMAERGFRPEGYSTNTTTTTTTATTAGPSTRTSIGAPTPGAHVVHQASFG